MATHSWATIAQKTAETKTKTKPKTDKIKRADENGTYLEIDDIVRIDQLLYKTRQVIS